MAFKKLMVKFTEEQWQLMEAGKIILNRHALLPRKITPLNNEQYIMDCVMHQSNQLAAQLRQAVDKEKAKDATSSTGEDTSGDSKGELRSEHNISTQAGDVDKAVPEG